jgi:hypothetical protein
MVARGWGCDHVPPRWEPGDQDAGDHKGPPIHSQPPSPLQNPGPASRVDAYWATLAVALLSTDISPPAYERTTSRI